MFELASSTWYLLLRIVDSIPRLTESYLEQILIWHRVSNVKINPPPLTFVVALKLMLKFKLTSSNLKQTAFRRNNTNDLINQTKKSIKMFYVLKDENVCHSVFAHLQFHWLNCSACVAMWLIMLWAIPLESSIQFKIICGCSFHQFGHGACIVDRCIENLEMLSQHRLYAAAIRQQLSKNVQ